MKASDYQKITMEDFNRLSFQDAQDALKVLRKAVNQRVSRLKKSGTPSPALRSFSEGGKLKSGKGLTRNETLAEVKRAIDFMNAKTSTVKGAKQVQKKTLESLGLDPDTTPEEATDAYDMFNKLKEEFPSILNEATGGEYYASYKKRVGQMIQRGESYEAIREEMQKIYEEQQAAQMAAVREIESGF